MGGRFRFPAQFLFNGLEGILHLRLGFSEIQAQEVGIGRAFIVILQEQVQADILVAGGQVFRVTGQTQGLQGGLVEIFRLGFGQLGLGQGH